MRDALTVWLADPSPLFREGLNYVLRKPRFVVERMGATLGEVLDFSAQAPAIVIFSGSVEPEADVLLRQMRERSDASTRFVLLIDGSDGLLDPGSLTPLIDAVLPKDTPSEAVTHFLEIVALGQPLIFMPPDRWMVGRSSKPARQIPMNPAPITWEGDPQTDPPPTLSLAIVSHAGFQDDYQVNLSERESEILQCLTLGLSNKAIARELKISDCTVKVHMKSLLRKIRVQNRTQAAVWANETRLAGQFKTSNGHSGSDSQQGAHAPLTKPNYQSL